MRRACLFPQDFPRAQEFCIQLVGFLEEKSILSLLQQPHRHLETRPCLCPGLPVAAQPQLLGAGIVVTWYISHLSILAHAFWQLRAHPCASQSLKGFVACHFLHLKRDPLTSMLRASSCASLPGTGVPGLASTRSWCSQLCLHSGTEPRQGKQLACRQPPARVQGLLLAHWLPLLGCLAFLFTGPFQHSFFLSALLSSPASLSSHGALFSCPPTVPRPRMPSTQATLPAREGKDAGWHSVKELIEK